MALIDRRHKLADIILDNPSIITVLNRFDIYLGVGDKTVEQICSGKQLDTDFFIIILNTFANEEYFPEELLKNFDVKLIINYLECTNDYYMHFILPNIENHFNLLLKRSEGKNSNIELLLNFFLEVKTELLNRIKSDTDKLFSNILMLDCNNNTVERYHSPQFKNEAADDAMEDKINDLVNMFVIHLTGKYDTNLCLAVLSAIISLKKDLCQNNRIRNRILMPIYHYLSSQQANA